MIPIAKPNIGKEELNAVAEVLASGQLAQGSKVAEFEEKFASYIGTDYAIATSSGTSALLLIYKALNLKGKEILMPSFTFIATATAALAAGAKPVFVDVDPKTFCISIKDAKRKITEKTAAIVPVHLYGLPADMDAILEFAEKHNLYVIEDACQAHGAEYKGKKAGSFGIAAAFSFYPTKNMTTGEGGMVTTNDEKLAEKISLLRNHGQKSRYEHVLLGLNYRMTNIAAAIGLVQLKKLDKMNEKRIENAKYYLKKLKDVPNITLPYIPKNRKHVFHQFTVKVKNREKLIQKLKQNNIGFGIYYPKGCHQQKIFKGKLSLPNTERLCKEVISLPVCSLITKKELKKITLIFSDII